MDPLRTGHVLLVIRRFNVLHLILGLYLPYLKIIFEGFSSVYCS